MPCVCVCERDEPLSIVPIRAKLLFFVLLLYLTAVDVSGARFWLRVSVVHFFFLSLSLILIIPSLGECGVRGFAYQLLSVFSTFFLHLMSLNLRKGVVYVQHSEPT